jgi:hypothetical protein
MSPDMSHSTPAADESAASHSGVSELIPAF